MGQSSKSLAGIVALALALCMGGAALAVPLPPTGDLVVQLIADQGTLYGGNPVANGGLVAEWHDQATAIGGDNFAQVNTDARRPRLYKNVLGGHSVIRFDGTQDLLCADGTWSAMDGDEATWFVVFKSDFSTQQSLVRMRTSTNSNLYGSLVDPASGGKVISHSRTSGGSWVSTENTSMASSDYFVLSGVWAGDNTINQWVAPQNGTQVTASTGGATNSGGTFTYFRIGTQTGGSTPLKGDIAEILVYGAELSTIQRRDTEDYLYNKYFRNGGVKSAQYSQNVRLHATMDTADISGSTVLDTEGAAQNGTVVGAVSNPAGRIGQGLLLTGSDSNYVDFGNVFNPGADSFTASLWFNPSDVSGNEFLVGKGNASSSGLGWSIWKSGDDLYVRGQQVGGGGGDRFGQSLPDSLLAGTWQHVVIVLDRDDDTIRGYLNGTNAGWLAAGGGAQTDSLVPGSTIATGDFLYLGRRWTTGASYSGLLDDFIIWDRALNPSEISALYQMGLAERSYPGYPEPGTLTLLAFGGMGMLARRRRRRRK